MSLNAIELLINDHEIVKELLGELMTTSNRATKKRKELLDKIDQELKLHTRIEEEIFYPAFKKAGKKEEAQMYFEAIEEHRAVEELVLPDLESTEVNGDKFGGRAKVLKELLEHHIEEEESEMFPRARELFSDEQLEQLGEQMQAMKDEMKTAAAA